MVESTWLMLIVWVIFFVLQFKLSEHPIIPGVAGVLSVILGINFIQDALTLFGFIFVALGIYSLYLATFKEVKK